MCVRERGFDIYIYIDMIMMVTRGLSGLYLHSFVYIDSASTMTALIALTIL